MTDRSITIGALIALVALCFATVWQTLPSIEDGVTLQAAESLIEAGIEFESISAEGRIATVKVPSNSAWPDEAISEAIGVGFSETVFRLEVDRSGRRLAPTTTTTVPPTTTTTEPPVIAIKDPTLLIAVKAGRIASLEGTVGLPSDTSALADAVGPPRSWDLTEDPTTLPLPAGVVAIIDAAGDALVAGDIVYTDGNVGVFGLVEGPESLISLRDLLEEGGDSFTASYDLAEDASAIEAAIVEVAIEGIRFSSGTATIRQAGRTILDRVAAILLEDPTLLVQIIGHTDSSGNSDANLTLSLDRAVAVNAYLVAAGVDDASLSSEGRGDSEPVADNTTPSGRATNRRIEFIVSRRGVASS